MYFSKYNTELHSVEMANLVELPLSVAAVVIGDWLDLKAVVNLDSSFCNHKSKSQLLEVLASVFCILDSQENHWSLNSVKWLLKRQLKVANVNIDLKTEYLPIILYLGRFSDTVRKIVCKSYSNHVIANIVACNMCKLTSFSFCNSPVTSNLNKVLRLNPQLRELRLENVTGLQVSHFDGISLAELRKLSLRDTNLSNGLLCAIFRDSKLLTHINLESCNRITDVGLISLAQHCPLLRCINLYELDVNDQTLSTIVTHCPLICHLDIAHNSVVTDAGIQRIARGLANLRGLAFYDCDLLTDESLIHLTNHCANALEIVDMGLLNVRASVMIALLQQCTKLHTLSTDLQLHKCYKTIIPHMCNLKTLLLFTVVTDDMLVEIAHHCKLLEVLTLETNHLDTEDDVSEDVDTLTNEINNIDISNDRIVATTEKSFADGPHYTQNGLFAIARGLPQLRTLGVIDDFTTTLGGKLALELWRVMCPRLRVISAMDYEYFDVLEQDLEV